MCSGYHPTGLPIVGIHPPGWKVDEPKALIVDRSNRGGCGVVAGVTDDKHLKVAVRLLEDRRDRTLGDEWPAVVGGNTHRHERLAVLFASPANVPTAASLGEEPLLLLTLD